MMAQFPHFRGSWSVQFIFLISILSFYAVYAEDEFPFYKYKGGLSDVGKLAAFGDFDNDRLYVSKPWNIFAFNRIQSFSDTFNSTDVFIIPHDASSVDPYIWNSKSYNFSKTGLSTIKDPNLQYIQVIPSDYNNDGYLDVLVVANQKNDPGKFVMQIHLGNLTHFTEMIPLDPPTGQVSIFDYNIDLKPDLIGNSIMDGKVQRVVWLNEGDEVLKFKRVLFDDDPSLEPLSDNFATSLIDLDGDCLSELIVPVGNDPVSFEVWYMNTTLTKYLKHPRYNRIEGVRGQGQLTFVDVDGDGNIDVLIPVCYPRPDCSVDNYLKIIYNIQKSGCGSVFSKNCRKSSELCSADPNFRLAPFSSTNESEVVIIHHPEGYKWAVDDEIPITVRAADLNMDRFPDIFVPTVDRSGDRRVYIWMSKDCTKALCGDNKRRTFVKTTETNNVDRITNAMTAATFSYNEQNRNDVIVVTKDQTTKRYSIQILENAHYNDAYFLKLLGLNGVCTMCLRKSGGKPYSVNQHGTVFKVTYSDLFGNQIFTTLPQLPQSSHMSLQTPYVFTSILRPSNYVDYVFMGVMVKTKEDHQYQSWPGIIPNSQVVVSPYPKESPSQWGIELYISPSKATGWIALAVICWLLVMGAAIIGLQYREKRQDDREKKEKEHLFSFKAM